MSSSARYGLWSSLVALAGLPVIAAAERGGSALRWSLLGWAIMVVTGVMAGIALSARHGQPGGGFVIALGVSMGARLLLSAVGGAAAAGAGRESLGAYVVGLGAGYVPLQVFETVWFLRASRGSVPARLEVSRR